MRYLLFFIFLGIYTTHAQTSIFEDSEGESAYKLFDNAIAINSSAQSVTFNIARLDSADVFNSPFHFTRKGISVKINAQEGISNIKVEDEFTLDGEIGVYYGIKKTGNLKGTDFKYERYISGGAGIERNAFFTTENDSIQIETISRSNFRFEIGQFGYVNRWLYGINIKGGLRSNINGLRANNLITITDSVSSGAVLITSEQTAFNRANYQTNLAFINFNADIAFQLNKKQVSAGEMPGISAAFHFRYSVLEDVKPRFNPAVGLYFAAKEGAPQKIGFGINAQLIDAFDVQNNRNTAWERTAITLNAGYKFN